MSQGIVNMFKSVYINRNKSVIFFPALHLLKLVLKLSPVGDSCQRIRVGKLLKRLCLDCILLGVLVFLKVGPHETYYKEDFSAIKEVYDYKNYIFSVYKLKLTKDKQFEDIAEFCKENVITTLTVPKKKVTDERIKITKDKGLRIATHTVNSKKDRESFTEMGVDILYSDFLKEK